MFLPDCDMVIHLKVKIKLLPKNQSRKSRERLWKLILKTIVLPEAQKEQVVSFFSFWVLRENFPALCQLSSVSIEAT